MTQRNISEDNASTIEGGEKKVYESPVLNVLASEDTANDVVAADDNGVNSS